MSNHGADVPARRPRQPGRPSTSAGCAACARPVNTVATAAAPRTSGASADAQVRALPLEVLEELLVLVHVSHPRLDAGQPDDRRSRRV